MPQFLRLGFPAFFLALLVSLCPRIGPAQSAAEKPQSSGPPVQKEDIPPAPALRDFSAFNISDDTRTLITEALKAGDYTRVEHTLAKLIEQNPQSAQLLTFVGRIFLLDNKPLNCAVALKKAEKLEPLKESDRFTLALSYVILKKPDWASGEFEKLAQSNPKNALYPYWQGRIAYDGYAFATAVEKFKIALELDPEYARAYDNLGLCYEGMSNNALAIENYERAVALNRRKSPASPWPPLNYGMLLIKQGALDQAETVLREAVNLGPGMAQTHHQLGILYGKQKKFAEAIDELKKAGELNPSYPESHLTLAHVYRQAGEKDKAEAELATFEKLKHAQKVNERAPGSNPTGENPR